MLTLDSSKTIHTIRDLRNSIKPNDQTVNADGLLRTYRNAILTNMDYFRSQDPKLKSANMHPRDIAKVAIQYNELLLEDPTRRDVIADMTKKLASYNDQNRNYVLVNYKGEHDVPEVVDSDLDHVREVISDYAEGLSQAYTDQTKKEERQNEAELDV